MKMTTEEAFVKVLQLHGIEHAFGIIGSAMMPISDIFEPAGITFWDCAHEGSGGFMADGYTRATGKMSMMIAQNGPGITNFVTAVKTAYWNHTPLLLVTPQAANKTMGQGGFQEMEQMRMFADCVCYQEEVRDPSRMAEVLNRVIMQAKRNSAPAQINVPRDYFTQVVDIELPAVVDFERPAGGTDAVNEAAELLSSAKFPVILNGAGVVIGGAIPASMALAERLDAPLVLQPYSRLVIDCNRPLDAEDSIPEVSDGIHVPGNAEVDAEHRRRRVEGIFTPFHDRITLLLEDGETYETLRGVMIKGTARLVVDQAEVHPLALEVMKRNQPDIPEDMLAQANPDSDDADGFLERYPNAIVRDFDGDPARVTEMDALIAYLQMLGTLVDFSTFDDQANLR